MELLSPDSLNKKVTVKEIRDMEGSERETAHLVQEKVLVNLGESIRKGDMLRRRISE